MTPEIALLALQIVPIVAVLRHFIPKIDGWIVLVVAVAVSCGLVALRTPEITKPAIELALFAGFEAVGMVQLGKLALEKAGAVLPKSTTTTVVNAPEAKMVAVESVRPPPPPMFPPSDSGLPQATLERL